MKKLLLTVIAISFITSLSFFNAAFAQTTVVVPNLNESSTGDDAAAPFNCVDSGGVSMRYQQVYLGSEFPQAGLIDKISFRLNNGIGISLPGFGPTTIPNVQIELSTTQKQPNGQSNTFADNVGADVKTVYSGDLTLSAPSCNMQLCPFDIMIPLQNPFYYDPQNGNLLLDVRIPVCEKTSDFDGSLFPGIVSRVYSTDVDSPTASPIEFSTRGLVTQFQISAPPQFITLSPGSATNDVFTEHTVTATVITNGLPDPGELVTFDVVSGPNAGEVSDPNSGECSSNDDCTTDANGEVSWTYTGSWKPGTDKIEASLVNVTGAVVKAAPVEKTWVKPPDPIPTLSEWGLIAMAGILGVAGFMVLRRRNAAA